jgi:hypothetical protein
VAKESQLDYRNCGEMVLCRRDGGRRDGGRRDGGRRDGGRRDGGRRDGGRRDGGRRDGGGCYGQRSRRPSCFTDEIGFSLAGNPGFGAETLRMQRHGREGRGEVRCRKWDVMGCDADWAHHQS